MCISQRLVSDPDSVDILVRLCSDARFVYRLPHSVVRNGPLNRRTLEGSAALAAGFRESPGFALGRKSRMEVRWRQ